MREIKVSGFVTIEAPALNVGDLRKLVKYLDKHGVPSETEIDSGYTGIFIDMKTSNAMWIECGEHMADDTTYDILLETHEHEENKQL